MGFISQDSKIAGILALTYVGIEIILAVVYIVSANTVFGSFIGGVILAAVGGILAVRGKKLNVVPWLLFGAFLISFWTGYWTGSSWSIWLGVVGIWALISGALLSVAALIGARETSPRSTESLGKSHWVFGIAATAMTFFSLILAARFEAQRGRGGTAEGDVATFLWMLAAIGFIWFWIWAIIAIGNIAEVKGYSKPGFIIFAIFFPVISLIVALILQPSQEKLANSGNPGPDQKVMLATSGIRAGSSKADELKKLSELRDQGILTEDEFISEKSKLLNS
jgi:hypothetical protein